MEKLRSPTSHASRFLIRRKMEHGENGTCLALNYCYCHYFLRWRKREANVQGQTDVAKVETVHMSELNQNHFFDVSHRTTLKTSRCYLPPSRDASEEEQRNCRRCGYGSTLTSGSRDSEVGRHLWPMNLCRKTRVDECGTLQSLYSSTALSRLWRKGGVCGGVVHK